VTENDKTGDKLAVSIRRTRASVSKKATVAKKKVSAASAKSATRRSPQSAAKPAAAEPAATRPNANTDPYQVFERVWPD
jgi:hypothetical protein